MRGEGQGVGVDTCPTPVTLLAPCAALAVASLRLQPVCRRAAAPRPEDLRL